MIYTSLNRIKENILERNWLFWRMYQKDEKNLIAECINVDNLNPKKSADYLTEEIEALEGSGYVIVKLYQKPLARGGDNSGNLNFYVRINGQDNEEAVKGVNTNQNNNFGMISGFFTQINALNMELMQERNNASIKALEAKYESKNQSTSVDPMLKEILGIAKTVLAPKMMNNNPPATSSNNHTMPINGIDERKDFTELIKKWHSLDKNYIETIKAIVYFAETDYSSYRQNIDLLINAYKNK